MSQNWSETNLPGTNLTPGGICVLSMDSRGSQLVSSHKFAKTIALDFSAKIIFIPDFFNRDLEPVLYLDLKNSKSGLQNRLTGCSTLSMLYLLRRMRSRFL